MKCQSPPGSARAQSCIWWVFCVCNNFVLDSFHHYACPALHVAWDFNSSNFPGLLLWIPKTGELSNCRKYVSCKTLPILEWLGPLKFTPVKFGGVGYWMVDELQISYVVDSWTLSFKIKVKIKVKEHLYNFTSWMSSLLYAQRNCVSLWLFTVKTSLPWNVSLILYYTEANPQWTWGFLLPMTGFTNVVPYFGCCSV